MTNAHAAATKWDAFISYAHEDQHIAFKVQAFIEDYPLPSGRRLRLFRDETDMPAGELDKNILDELGTSRALLLCCSPSIVDSYWVQHEITAFQNARPGHAVVPLLLAGDLVTVVPESIRSREALVLDLRAGWRFGRAARATRIELLRAIAAIADIPLRELIPWDEQRRRRRRAAILAVSGIASMAIAVLGTMNWLARRDAQADALRREADAAILKLDAGDIPAGLAELGRALAHDPRHILDDRVDVFRHWITTLTPARDTVRSTQGLLSLRGRIYVRATGDRLLRLDLPGLLDAVVPWPGTVVATGQGAIAIYDTVGGKQAGIVALPPGTKIKGIYEAQGRAAVTVLAQMARVENDEDEPEVPVPCSVLLLHAPRLAITAGTSYPVRIAAREGGRALRMQALRNNVLLWHDCTPEKAEQYGTGDDAANAISSGPPASPDASTSPAPATSPTAASAPLALSVDVPRLLRDTDNHPDGSRNWDDTLRQKWSEASPLPVMELPEVRKESRHWRETGPTPITATPKRHGIAASMTDADIEALDISVAKGGTDPSDLVEFGGFASEGQRVFWGIAATGNSLEGISRCQAPPDGQVSHCVSGMSFNSVRTWNVVAPDARRLLHVSAHAGEPPLTVVDLVSYRTHQVEPQTQAPVLAAAFTGDNARFAALTTSDQLLVYAFSPQGEPRYERSLRLGQSAAIHACSGLQALLALREARMVALSADCTLELFDLTAGRLLWRKRLDVPAECMRPEKSSGNGGTHNGTASSGAAGSAKAMQIDGESSPSTCGNAAQLALTRDGERLLVSLAGRVRLLQSSSGTALATALDAAELSVAPSSGNAPATTGTIDVAQDGTVSIDVDGRRFSRTEPPTAGRALALLPQLDRYTMISTSDGRAELDSLP
ncbi:toll/interleukin-1 receptor domain-containing protein [Cupriavidus necator]|uniref:toll/interleukin-1 receptor domain-containing protein n=1 Tax=Cupriavidus necator TaxID=106590 RepID=UPI0039C4C16C